MEWNWFGQGDLSKGQKTQLRIIDSALALFSRSGFQAVTLQQIAKHSKTSHPLILKHFASKENLLLAVRKFVSFNNHQWVDSKILPDMDGRERVFHFCYENLVWGSHFPEQAKIILLTYYYHSLEDSGGASPGAQAFDMGVGRLHQHCLAAEREGLLDFDGDLKLFSEMLHEYAVGLFVRLVATQGTSAKRLPRKYKDKLEIFLDHFFVSS